MRSFERRDLLVSGLGVVSAIGQGRKDFLQGLMEGRQRFAAMQRPGRQRPEADPALSLFLGAEIGELGLSDRVSPSLQRAASWSGKAALAALGEAWLDACLDEVPPHRIGLVVGGSNLQQRELMLSREAYRGRESFLRPTYALSFMDSDICGLCTEAFGIRGMAYTAGGASASGQLAVLQACEAVESGRVDVCIALGALMDLSYWECQSFRSLGAMGSDRYADAPQLACRPFDEGRDGFIYGEACGAVVVERAGRKSINPYARLSGRGIAMDGNRNPNPSLEGEVEAIRQALETAGLRAADIDYINPHGTGSALGDATELQALRASGLNHVRLNATKALVGHGLSAAGAVELIAGLLQMREGRLHPTRNLDSPMAPDLGWTGSEAARHEMRHALNLSMGFGGINTAVCFSRV
ncbi:Polyketide biosynthesis malonyl-ACP decarboxylase PksF [Chromobacterium vaccinii]|nr:Polyketide biosynthesis malonyl-ACP decarboxylase PksF [Chromobacterium vaccinii]QND90373.1 Polyketide biosynthesis malonyl-ACP decarboxylase PksF [Chromobacterium vaccinii]